jgi:two-component system, OmpR family, sensor kinase
MSLSVRLMLLNGLVLILVLGGFAGVAYVTQEQSLQRSLDASLQEQARLLRGNLPAAPERGRGRPPSGGALPGPPIFVAPDVFTQITRISDGVAEPVARSRNLGEQSLPTDAELLGPALAGRELFENVEVEGQPYRMFVAPIRRAGSNDGGPVLVLQVARPLAGVQGSLSTLLTTFATLGALGVLASLAAGWLLARAALRPIDRLAAVTHAIGAARDFGRRVPTPTGRRRDEVGRLTDELNQMLAQLQVAYGQLEAVNGQLEQALASQRRFVADASHELRTPLTSLRGNLDLLQRQVAAGEPIREQHEQFLEDMIAETERVSRLVADLLLLAQADAGQHLTLQTTDLGTVVRNAFRAARFLRDDVYLDLGETPDGLLVAADPDRLKQLCLILLDNGLKYTPPGGRVSIAASLTVRSGVDGIALTVTDTGPGIPPEHRARIFERFFRADPARHSQGSGLGLAIARWIVDEHQGIIEVESEPGQGSTFTVWLPSVARPVPTSPPSDDEVTAPPALAAV